MSTAADGASSAAGDESVVTPAARRNVTFHVGGGAKTGGVDNPLRSAAGSISEGAPGDPLSAPAAVGGTRPGASRSHAAVGVSSSSYDNGSAEPPPPPFVLTREDVEAAFNFFDVTRTGVLNMATLKQRLSAFYPSLTSKEYRFLLEDPAHVGGSITEVSASAPGSAGAGGGFTVGHLWELIDTYQRLYGGADAAAAAAANSSGGPRGIRRVSSGSTRARPAQETGGGGAVGAPSREPEALPALGLSSGNYAQIFDPITEAFRVFDPTGKLRCVDVDVLAQIMARIGYGELSDAELRLLVRTADFDGDGRISLDDFRQLVTAKGRQHGGGAGAGGRRDTTGGSGRRNEKDTKTSPSGAKRK